MVDRWLTERARAAEAEVPGGFGLSACVREPIHLLGGVQSHGTLIAVEPASGLVAVAAANTGELLGIAAEQLVGTPVTRVLAPAEFEEALAGTAGEDPAPVTFPVPVGGTGSERPMDVSAHRRGGLLVLEFEPRRDETPAFGTFYTGIRRVLARLRAASTVADACEVAAREVRALTGYDRVMVYRFDGEAGPGEVVAEDLTPGWEPWLGLWFPATDVPPQARRLYRDNWIRVIGDAHDETVGLVPPVRPDTGVPLDLSLAALRTVSGFHLEYLRNIGVRSSMSVSVLREGRLWGLIACHGERPLRPTPEVRSACEMFGAAFSLQLAAIEERERADAIVESGGRAATVARLLEDGLEVSVAGRGDAVADLLAADSVVLCRGGRVSGSGDTFAPGLLRALGSRAALLAPGTVWETDRLAESDGEEAAFGAQESVQGPAGVLLLPLSRSGDFLAWSRRERPVPRRWATDPAAPVRVGPGGERLTPRGSGAVFAAMMRGRSLPWTTTDLATARELWRLLTGLVLRHADAVDALNDELRMTNTDLDGFAHAAAHDLKEPLRGISNAATFVIEDAAAGLDETTRRRLLTMQQLAGRMDELLNSLLHYSRLGRAGLRLREVDLGRALDSALEVAGGRLAEERVRVRRGELPVLAADPDRLYEILVNLLVNAAKYAAPESDDRWVEIAGHRLPVPGESSGAQAYETVVTVRDNGIGIAPGLQEEVFDLFRRLHGPSEHGGGSGVGLAVVKRVVERHGGRLWLESAPGRGATFSFTLGPAVAGEPKAAG
ncbi:ATP-binding protein [Streptomyces spiramenti]|uniref:Sensor-like histidine kinase SenX3 n=1 Tax=Streptomyces spiramenti TaxID=2720606 RepID=A0ABX1AMC0_9ACTN|nr:ATP-binding protein [Streptomyces spiramenti]NJP67405.1 GAF domain-containing protein [Streptomyces spiramenti]